MCGGLLNRHLFIKEGLPIEMIMASFMSSSMPLEEPVAPPPIPT